MNPASTGTALVSSQNPSVSGQSISLTATVSVNSPGSGSPSGIVNFYDDATLIGSETLTAGSASLVTSAFTVGSHLITAVYAGTSQWGGSTSNTITQADDQDATTTVVTSSSGTSSFGQGVTFTATVVASAPGGGTPTGTITFFSDGTQIGNSAVTLVNGVATINMSSLSVATHSITAIYSGDNSFSASGNTGAPLSQTVNPATTSTTISADHAPSVFGETITFAATVAVTGAGSGTPTGQVQFAIDGGSPSSVNVVNGIASFTTSILSVGDHTIDATYAGDGNFDSSVATTDSQTVDQAATAITVSSSDPTAVFGENVTLTANVSAVAPGAGTPDGGLVTFYTDGDTGSPLGTATVSNGVATLADIQWPVGAHAITAGYAGDGVNFAGSVTTGSFDQQVNQATTSLTRSSSGPTVFGQSATFTVTVAITGNGAGTPTGTVTFYADGNLQNPIGSSALSAGTATISDSALSVGTHSIIAQYSGDPDFAGSNASAVTQVVGPAATSVAVSSSNANSVYGEAPTLTATVSATAPGAGTPTGTVSFYDGADLLGTGTLSSGQAPFDTSTLGSFLAIGNHSITASYAGDGDFSSSDSSGSPFTQAVTAANTSTVVTSSLGTSVFDQQVTFSATVSASSPGGRSAGRFGYILRRRFAGQQRHRAQRGAASFADSSLAVGTAQNVTAVYSPANGNYNTSTSTGLSQNVNPADTAIVLATSNSSAVYGEPITLTATVTATVGTGVPTGTVIFSDTDGQGNTVQIGATQNVDGNGQASITLAIPVGVHTLTAGFVNGDGNFNNSDTASSLSQTVSKDAVTVAVGSSLASGSVSGQSVTFTATVAAVGPGSGAATGAVTFYSDNVMIGVSTLNAGVVTLDDAVLAVGSHTITASYSGDGNFLTGSATGINQPVSQASTTTALVSSQNPSVFGQSVSFTATVSVDAPGAGSPSGTVQFYDGATLVDSETLSSGSATFVTSALSVGSHAITAVYLGTSQLAGDTSNTVTQVTGQDATATVVASSSSTSSYGQLVTLTATISASAPGAGTPSGTVTFYSDGTQIGGGAISLVNGVATIDTPALSVATHSITAIYSGDASFSASDNTGASLSQVVNPATTGTTLSADQVPSVFGQPVTFSATVAVTGNGSGTPTGQVEFSVDGGSPFDVSVVSGVASFTTSSLSVGGHTVDANYLGDGNFSASVAPTDSQTVNPAATAVAVGSSDSNASFGENVTLTASVSAVAPGAGTPNAGLVTFYADGNTGTPLGTGSVSNGVATLTNVQLSVGTHAITASYAGDASDFSGSTTAGGFSQHVAQATTSLALGSTTATVFGQAASFTATIAVTGSGAGTPTGTMTFYADGDLANPIGSGTLSGGAVTISDSALSVADHSITASYGGDTNFVASTADAVTQSVGLAATSVVVSSSDSNSVYGESPTLTASVSVTAPGAGTPTGTVSLYDGATLLGTGALVAGHASFDTSVLGSFLSIGNHSITASYASDGSFASSDSSGAPLTQAVAANNTSTTVTSSLATSVFDQQVTFTATVSAASPGGGTPDGSVTFYVGAAPISSATPLSGGVASFNDSNLAVGAGQNVTAVYSPANANYNGSTSPVLTQNVNPADTTIALATSNAAAVSGESITLTATVAPTAGSGVPTGTVVFSDTDGLGNTVQIGATQNVDGSGQASITLALSVGIHNLTATYTNADGNFNGSNTASSLPQTVNQDAVTVGLASSLAGGSVFGQGVTYTAAVSAVAPGSGAPTGTITFYADGTMIGADTLNAGVATLTYSGSTVGTHVITASYGGDANFLPGSAAGINQVVGQASTTTALVSSQNPVVSGQSVSFTATVSVNAPGAGAPPASSTSSTVRRSSILKHSLLAAPPLSPAPLPSAPIRSRRSTLARRSSRGALQISSPRRPTRMQRLRLSPAPRERAATGRTSPSLRRSPPLRPAAERRRGRSRSIPMGHRSEPMRSPWSTASQRSTLRPSRSRPIRSPRLTAAMTVSPPATIPAPPWRKLSTPRVPAQRSPPTTRPRSSVNPSHSLRPWQ